MDYNGGMPYTVLVEDEFGIIRGSYIYNSLSEAKRVAGDSAQQEQGRAVVTEDDGEVVIEYRYEGGRVKGYDDLGNQITGLRNF